MFRRFVKSGARGAFIAPALLAVLAAGALVGRRPAYDPLAQARAVGMRIENREAPIPSMCYTKTDGVANPCWTCHTGGVGLNGMDDAALQSEYAFSDVGMTNHWTNLFADRSAAVARISDDEVLAYIREDNYSPLREALERLEGYPGYTPDLDFAKGFDEDGFARDGSGWRALRYKPFLGTFWPTNGSTDDVFIRLPPAFRRDAAGRPSRDVYRINLSILEAAMTAEPTESRPEKLRRTVEPLDERVAGVDLDRDGQLSAEVTELIGLPATYVGGAGKEPVATNVYPGGTEFLHSVRYVDPDEPALLATRMKELRYMRKVGGSDTWRTLNVYEEEKDKKMRGLLPVYAGTPDVGLLNDFGWQLQGFIEDAEGRLRLQTMEEHLYCMGCHGNLGVTVDQTFAFVRKVPGREGWRYQDLRGMKDVPQRGHVDPEVLTYFQRVKGGDEFRANEEILTRFFPGGVLDEATVRRAARGGDKDLAFLVSPSRERALALDKAYLALVREQSFIKGRDTLLAPPRNVHQTLENGSTGLEDAGRVYPDGRLHLDWE
ncbi:MAG TPA: hypothetical protein VFZ09_34460 [Archangium sp.]|uniref:hypothetical protein n=1 Tax=Archangium sp. TaxID=1872627 RepID=UPI002E33AD1A|nr:hypothetical protein [Archangium sp.]HEX5751379.1 hypothetical protein [Archangium sp.]